MHDPASRLLKVAERVTPEWCRRLLDQFQPGEPPDPLDAERDTIVQSVSQHVLQELTELLMTDPDVQRTNPLTVFRRSTAPITAILRKHGVPSVQRDEFHQRSFPDDVYGLYPATWADIAPELVEPGLEWGAWKAATMISRHGS